MRRYADCGMYGTTREFIGNLDLDFARALTGAVTQTPRVFCFDWKSGEYQHTLKNPGPTNIVISKA